jgi:transcription initiation factor TFIIB
VLLYLGSEVERMGTALDASEETIVDAIRLCGDVLRSDYDYDSLDSVAGACFYLACTRQDAPISLPDVADQARKSQNNIQHLSANLMSELNIQPTPTHPDTYLEEGIEEFDFTEEQATECFELLERGKEQNLHSGFAPTTVAGAILYAVAQKHGRKLRQKDVADFVNKTTVSIRNSYTEYLKLADDVPVNILPPQTIDDAIATLETTFDDHPARYANDAAEIAAVADIENSVREAGVAGGAYVTVARAHGETVAISDVSSALGVGYQTVANHTDRFTYDK